MWLEIIRYKNFTFQKFCEVRYRNISYQKKFRKEYLYVSIRSSRVMLTVGLFKIVVFIMTVKSKWRSDRSKEGERDRKAAAGTVVLYPLSSLYLQPPHWGLNSRTSFRLSRVLSTRLLMRTTELFLVGLHCFNATI